MPEDTNRSLFGPDIDKEIERLEQQNASPEIIGHAHRRMQVLAAQLVPSEFNPGDVRLQSERAKLYASGVAGLVVGGAATGSLAIAGATGFSAMLATRSRLRRNAIQEAAEAHRQKRIRVDNALLTLRVRLELSSEDQ